MIMQGLVGRRRGDDLVFGPNDFKHVMYVMFPVLSLFCRSPERRKSRCSMLLNGFNSPRTPQPYITIKWIPTTPVLCRRTCNLYTCRRIGRRIVLDKGGVVPPFHFINVIFIDILVVATTSVLLTEVIQQPFFNP